MKQKVSLVLSGGGARGIAHIGVIEELEKQGYEITSVSGTSIGALVGGVYALGKMEDYKRWMYTLDKKKVFSLVDFTISSQGLVKGDKVLKKMKEFIPDSNIENLRIPYAAVAADILNKTEVVFTSGSVFDAIRASMSIPTVLTPVKTENGLLVDGGVVNNIPINHARRIPGDILIVVNVNADIPVYKPAISKKESDARESIYQKKIKAFFNQLQKIHPVNHEEKLGYFDLIDKTINLMMYRMEQLLLQNYSPDIIINVSRDSCNSFDYYKAEAEPGPLAVFVLAMSLTATGETEVNGVPVCIDEELTKPPQKLGHLTIVEHHTSITGYANPIIKAAAPSRPVSIAFFGGRVEYFRLNPFARLFVKLVIQARPGDRRNWKTIRSWAHSLPALLNSSI